MFKHGLALFLVGNTQESIGSVCKSVRFLLVFSECMEPKWPLYICWGLFFSLLVKHQECKYIYILIKLNNLYSRMNWFGYDAIAYITWTWGQHDEGYGVLGASH